MPGLIRRAGVGSAEPSYAGQTALAEETVSETVSDLKRIAIAGLCVNLLLLALFLRSLVAPFFLLGASVLAVAATLGLTTYVFQDLLGYGELTYYVPFAAAVLLVALGSDYNVYVVGQVWEVASRRPLRDAIATAVPRASRTISVAGIALAFSFALLAIVPLRAFRELAFTLCVGVLLDAFVVRSLLVPALIALFGNASWWPGRRIRRGDRPAARKLPPSLTFEKVLSRNLRERSCASSRTAGCDLDLRRRHRTVRSSAGRDSGTEALDVRASDVVDRPDFGKKVILPARSATRRACGRPRGRDQERAAYDYENLDAEERHRKALGDYYGAPQPGTPAGHANELRARILLDRDLARLAELAHEDEPIVSPDPHFDVVMDMAWSDDERGRLRAS